VPDKPSLFFDLDGPLLDVRARYHGVYSGIAAELGVEPLTLDRYWAAKRSRAPLASFFPGVRDQNELEQFYLARWLPQIEAPDALARDTVVPGAKECLASLQPSHALFLVTLRRDAMALAAQLEKTGLRSYFTAVRSGWVRSEHAPGTVSDGVRSNEGAAGVRLKAGWIQELLTGSAALIGDSEIDMEAARLARIQAIGVSFGIREPADLLTWGADVVLDDIRELPALLGRLWAVSDQLSAISPTKAALDFTVG
jgi:phosphoglycolate phosphatase-like HAD superfamily hydrolase